MLIIHGPLSRRARHFWPRSMVVENSLDLDHALVLQRHGYEDVSLGCSEADAKDALRALVAHSMGDDSDAP